MNFFDSIVLIGIPSKLRIIPVLKKNTKGRLKTSRTRLVVNLLNDWNVFLACRERKKSVACERPPWWKYQPKKIEIEMLDWRYKGMWTNTKGKKWKRKVGQLKTRFIKIIRLSWSLNQSWINENYQTDERKYDKDFMEIQHIISKCYRCAAKSEKLIRDQFVFIIMIRFSGRIPNNFWYLI